MRQLIRVACLFFPLHYAAPLFNVDTPTAIEGEYIVVFKREMEDDDRKCKYGCIYY